MVVMFVGGGAYTIIGSTDPLEVEADRTFEGSSLGELVSFPDLSSSDPRWGWLGLGPELDSCLSCPTAQQKMWRCLFGSNCLGNSGTRALCYTKSVSMKQRTTYSYTEENNSHSNVLFYRAEYSLQ